MDYRGLTHRDFVWYRTPNQSFPLVLLGESRSQIQRAVSELRADGSSLRMPNHSAISPLETALVIPPYQVLERPARLFDDEEDQPQEVTFELEVLPGISFQVNRQSLWNTGETICRYLSQGKARASSLHLPSGVRVPVHAGDLFPYPTDNCSWLLPGSIMGALASFDMKRVSTRCMLEMKEEYFALTPTQRAIEARRVRPYVQ
jgi:hypothetical protein